MYSIHVAFAIVIPRERTPTIVYGTHKWFFPVRVVCFYVHLQIVLPIRF